MKDTKTKEHIARIAKASTYFIFRNGPVNKLHKENKVSDEELARRKADWKEREPRVTTGYLARYREMVTSGNRGAILETPRK